MKKEKLSLFINYLVINISTLPNMVPVHLPNSRKMYHLKLKNQQYGRIRPELRKFPGGRSFSSWFLLPTSQVGHL